MRHRLPFITMVSLSALVFSGVLLADGEVTLISGVDNWIAEFDEVEVADFTDFSDGDLIPNDHYADWGVTFGDPLNYALESVFFEDGHGMANAADPTIIEFDQPQTGIGTLALNIQRLHFYEDNILIHTSAWIQGGVGFILEKPLNRVIIEGLDGGAAVDNLYFVVPAPSAFGVFLFAALSRRRRRAI